MKKIITSSAQETKRFAKKFAGNFSQGGIVALSGELGAGKTTFAQGFADGLGIKGKIISPTFLIIRQYPIPNRYNFFYHIDLYRLENVDLKNSGLEEILSDPINVVLIEWADKLDDKVLKYSAKIIMERTALNQRTIKIYANS